MELNQRIKGFRNSKAEQNGRQENRSIENIRFARAKLRSG